MGEGRRVIEAYVDANGRVEDYRILSQPDDAKAVLRNLKEFVDLHHLPSRTFNGTPHCRTAVLSFSKISVKG